MGTLDPSNVSLFLIEDNGFTPHHRHTKQLHCHHNKHFTLVGFLKVGYDFLTI